MRFRQWLIEHIRVRVAPDRWPGTGHTLGERFQAMSAANSQYKRGAWGWVRLPSLPDAVSALRTDDTDAKRAALARFCVVTRRCWGAGRCG